MIEKILTRLKILLFFMCACVYAEAQEKFTYEDDETKTVITGLTDAGKAATTLSIPESVTNVNSKAFQDASGELKTLSIKGNPVFADNWFGKPSTLTIIRTGKGMSSANIKTLLEKLGEGPLETLEIDGYTDVGTTINWTNDEIKNVLKGTAHVNLPAALVTNQVFGYAGVYGYFEIAKELISFCGNATFQDTDHGSNMLFYVATGIESCGIKIQRVDYVRAGEGVLIHRTESGSGYCYLPRYTEDTSSDDALYSSNMLKGVTSATPIAKTDDTKTNLILSDGAFHPASGEGSLGANKAYLQVPTASLSSLSVEAPLMIDFEEETTGIGAALNDKGEMINDKWFTLQGMKLEGMPTEKGIYINGGRKVVIM